MRLLHRSSRLRACGIGIGGFNRDFACRKSSLAHDDDEGRASIDFADKDIAAVQRMLVIPDICPGGA